MLTISDFSGETGAILDLTRRLASMETPSHDKEALDRCAALVEDQLRQLGAEVEVSRQTGSGDHVIGRWRNRAAEGARGVLLLCHLDTVWDRGTLARRPLREEDGRLYGPGVFDMKAGAALALSTLRVLGERGILPPRPITVLFTADEETGSRTSRPLVEALAREAALVLVLGPALPSGAIKTARKGTGQIEIVARGRAAHAGADHARGRNAIEELAHHVLAAQSLTDYDQGTTVNVGVISGGTRPNVVPAEARTVADVRIATRGEVERLTAWAEGLQPVIDGAGVSAHLTLNRPPMVRDARMAATFACARSIARRAGLDLTEGSTGGGSDGNFAAALGVPVLDGLGAVGDGGHAEHEHILISALPERATLLAALLTEWPPARTG